MIDTQINTDKLLQFVGNKFEASELDNNSLVQLIEVCASYLNLKTIPKYAKDEGLSYNGAKHHRNVVKIVGVKFVIDND